MTPLSMTALEPYTLISVSHLKTVKFYFIIIIICLVVFYLILSMARFQKRTNTADSKQELQSFGQIIVSYKIFKAISPQNLSKLSPWDIICLCQSLFHFTKQSANSSFGIFISIFFICSLISHIYSRVTVSFQNSWQNHLLVFLTSFTYPRIPTRFQNCLQNPLF